jgi:endonuclease III
MPALPAPLTELHARLRRHFGELQRVSPTDPWEQVLHECACYLVNDARREQVWRKLKQEVGTAPEALLEIPASRLAQVIEAGGMKPPMRAEKLRTCAELAQQIGLPALRRAAKEDPAAALKLLRRFPGIGEPSAERILLRAAGVPSLGLESNGLRVLQRVGYGGGETDYTKGWRAVTAQLAPQLGKDSKRLWSEHSLLRHLGQVLCRTEPQCGTCPLLELCPTGQATQ